MSTPPQSPAYLARLRDRLVAIKQNTANIKTRITDSIDRKTQSWRTNPACHPTHPPLLAVTLPGNFRFTDTSSDDGSMSPLRRQNSNTRSDSMSPVVQEDAEEPIEGIFRGYYSMNSMKMRKLRLEERRKMLPGGEGPSGFTTVGRARGQELQDVLRSVNGRMKNGEGNTPLSGEQGGVDEETSPNPYPDDFPIPTSQPPSPPRTDGDAEISSNPYPDDFPIPSSTPKLLLHTQTSSQLRGRTSPSPQSSNFSIFPANRSISPISPYNATRRRLSAAQSPQQSQSHASVVSLQNSIRSDEQRNEWIDRLVQDHPDHEYNKMTREESGGYFDELSSYEDDSPKYVRRGRSGSPFPMRPGMLVNAQMGMSTPPIPEGTRERPGRTREAAEGVQDRLLGSAGQSYEGPQNKHDSRHTFLDSSIPGAGRLAIKAGSQLPAPNSRVEVERREESAINNLEPATQGTVIQTQGKRKSSAGRRLLHTIICRPGACTPDCPMSSTTGTHNPFTPTTTAAPQKFKLSSGFRELLTRRKDKGKVAEQPADPEPNSRRDYPVIERRRAIPSSWSESQENSHTYYVPPTPVYRIGQDNRSRQREVSNVASNPRGSTGLPVDLSKMIQRAPGSIISPSPSPVPSRVLRAGPSRYRESSQRQRSTTPRQQSPSAPRLYMFTPAPNPGPSQPFERHYTTQKSGLLALTQHSLASTPRQQPSNPPPQQHPSPPKLSSRLRQTRLEDLHGSSSSSAQEVRSLLSDIERDRHRHQTLPRRTNELPGGFTHDTMRTVTPLGTLDRRFTTQRQVNELVAYQSRARYRSDSSLRSHGSGLTVPRGWKVAEGGGDGGEKGQAEGGEDRNQDRGGDVTSDESFPMRDKGKGKARVIEQD